LDPGKLMYTSRPKCAMVPSTKASGPPADVRSLWLLLRPNPYTPAAPRYQHNVFKSISASDYFELLCPKHRSTKKEVENALQTYAHLALSLSDFGDTAATRTGSSRSSVMQQESSPVYYLGSPCITILHQLFGHFNPNLDRY
jgi:hypothetical protein